MVGAAEAQKGGEEQRERGVEGEREPDSGRDAALIHGENEVALTLLLIPSACDENDEVRAECVGEHGTRCWA
jgi:hypothetical protein